MHRSRRVHKDEELGKRDDDHRSIAETTWLWRRPRYRMKKILGLGFLALLIWLFVHYMPRDLGLIRRRYKGDLKPLSQGTSGEVVFTGPLPQSSKEREEGASSSHWYNGIIRYHKLAGSLHSIVKTQGHREVNRNILFAASSLKSSTALIPMACEMARWNRNYVHMAFFGRDELPIADILHLNGVDDEECDVYWHDARPDSAESSSDLRLEVSSAAGLGHVNTWMHPQALIMDDSLKEDVPFVKGIRAKAQDLGLPIIEVPADRSETLMWMTRLDSGSLRSWHKPTIDILVHGLSDGSGSLIRLLNSLLAADYAGLGTPRLTIELPSKVDPSTQRFLSDFRWPPLRSSGPVQINQLILHHRIRSQKVQTEESSIRFLESFYPAKAENSHVLVLAPQAELSPLYFHYLKYSLLEYKYSVYGAQDRNKLVGISLDLPSAQLNGATSFSASMKQLSETEQSATLLLWQAPDSNAGLYFGDKWTELHQFLTYRLNAGHDRRDPAKRPKMVNEAYPAWMGYFLEFMCTRGYSMLYPAVISPTPSTDHNAFVTIHNELYQAPEGFDFATSEDARQTLNSPNLDRDEPLTANPATHFKSINNPEALLTHIPLHRVIPDLPELPTLPMLSFDGDSLNTIQTIEVAETQAHSFRVEVGGCNPELLGEERAQRGKRIRRTNSRDLFCFEDDYEEGVLEWDHIGIENDLGVRGGERLEGAEGIGGVVDSGPAEPVSVATGAGGILTATGLAKAVPADLIAAGREGVP